MRTIPAQLLAALRALVVLTLLLGIAYPLVVTGISQVAFHSNANGSLVTVDGKVVGSDLLAQGFSDDKGNPLPQYFQPRPSQAGDGYDPTASAGSNLGPEDTTDTPDDPATSEDDSSSSLLTQVCTRSLDIGKADGVSGARPYCGADGVGTPGTKGDASTPTVPADAVTSSFSGLDPHISPANAAMQVDRVATARHLTPAQVRTLVSANTQGRTLGFLGEPRVNVLKLNLALDALSARP